MLRVLRSPAAKAAGLHGATASCTPNPIGMRTMCARHNSCSSSVTTPIGCSHTRLKGCGERTAQRMTLPLSVVRRRQLGTSALDKDNKFLWNVIIVRKGDPCPIVARVTDENIMQLSEDPSMHVRDLGLLHSQEMRQRMDVVVRDESILMRMLHVRAVLQKDMFVLFNAESRAVQDVAADVAKKAAEMEEHPTDWEKSFEAHALETVFKHLVRRLDHRLLQMQPLACALLREMEENISSEGLRKLLPIKETVGQLKTHAQEVAEVIKDLITDDDAMQRLDLSQTSTHEVATQQAGGKANRSRQVQQTERLLEFFRREVWDVVRDVELLDEKIDDTREVLNVALDNQRNRILKFNMELSCAAVAIALCALPAGIFGMNLSHGLEEAPGAFPVAVTAMCSVSILLYIMLSRQVRDGIARSSKHTADEVKALRSVLSMLDDIEDVFATKAAKGEINRERFRSELLRATGKHISHQEMDLICKAFDDDGDGQLQYETFEEMLKQSKEEVLKTGASPLSTPVPTNT